MGLSIYYYSKLVDMTDQLPGIKCVCGYCDDCDDAGIEDDESMLRTAEKEDFPGRLEGMKLGTIYKVAGESGSEDIGPCSSYNEWRNELAKLAGYPKGKYTDYRGNEVESHLIGAWEAGEGPFYEQLHFSDCEGNIGPVASKKLFEEYKSFLSMIELSDSFLALTLRGLPRR